MCLHLRLQESHWEWHLSCPKKPPPPVALEVKNGLCKMQTATMEFKKLFCFACLQRNVNCKFQIDMHAKNCKTKGKGKVKNSSAKQVFAWVRGIKWNCGASSGQLHDVKTQYLIKKIPCLDSWNHMISKAKHLCKKITSASEVWKRRKSLNRQGNKNAW